jgi:ribosomal protein S18 acetylase RimI-like enzyme
MVAFYSNDMIKRIGTFSILVVKSIFRGQGLGTTLFSAALKKMREAGMKRAQLGTSANNQSIRIYERLGFKIISRTHEQQGFSRVLMNYIFPGLSKKGL